MNLLKFLILISLFISNNLLSQVNCDINTLFKEAKNEEQQDFIIAQNINLDYLSDKYNYVLSPSNKLLLYSIGEKINPLSGYARSLYEVLTGERIELRVPVLRQSKRSGNLDNDKEQIDIYSLPNPINNDRHIIYFTDEGKNSNYSIKVFDMNGRIVLEKEQINSKQYLISTSSWEKGIYFLSVSNDIGEQVYNKKLIVIH